MTGTTQEATEVKKVQIRPDTSKMVAGKSPSGGKTFHADDTVGNALAGLTIVSAIAMAAEFGTDAAKWAHLNIGQQRMAIGGAIRKAIKAEDGTEDPAKVELLTSKANELRSSQVPAVKKSRPKKAVLVEPKAAEPAGEPA
jgi:hypothetical protein